MRRSSIAIAAFATLVFSTATFAADPAQGFGIASTGRAAHVTGGFNRSGEDGLARPGITVKLSHTGPGPNITSRVGAPGRGTDDGFHAAGMGKVINGGRRESTQRTVPGHTPVYIHNVVGTRTAPNMGSIGP